MKSRLIEFAYLRLLRVRFFIRAVVQPLSTRETSESLSRLINHLRIARFLVMAFSAAPFACRDSSAFRCTPFRLLDRTRAASHAANCLTRAEAAESSVGVLDLVESLLGDFLFCEEPLGFLQAR